MISLDTPPGQQPLKMLKLNVNAWGTIVFFFLYYFYIIIYFKSIKSSLVIPFSSLCCDSAEQQRQSTSGEFFTRQSSFYSCLFYNIYKSYRLYISGLCSVTDGPVSDSEGLIRNPTFPDTYYDNNQWVKPFRRNANSCHIETTPVNWRRVGVVGHWHQEWEREIIQSKPKWNILCFLLQVVFVEHQGSSRSQRSARVRPFWCGK